ncbi:MAG: PIG-L family deacetylase [Chitinophagaceae bacterium]|nr:PIG-L family deacetylase [Chitinophagaceae bacterium]
MRKTLLLASFVFCLGILSLPKDTFSQAPQNWTSADMYLALRKLNVLGSVLYIAAHPDDENTRLIAYLSKDKLYRTGYLSMTRGDGGQNLIGDEQGIELGLIRTQELLAARRIDGGEQFFTRAFDFGFSKNPEETFTKWDKEKILSDVVWVIRRFQPDVIITRFPTTGEGGHGHHTGSAILANEAFSAAADPNRFPEQLKYVQTWQVKRILWNTFNFGGNNTTREDQFKIDVGGYNPLLGKSYGEIAAESRSQHKSQGFGVPASRGESLEYFKATKGDQPQSDLMEGTDLSWKKVKGGQAIQTILDSLTASFDLLHPESSVQGLVRLYKAIGNLEEGYWKTQKLREVSQLIAQCSGLFLDVTTSEQFAVQTDSVRINFSFNNRLGTDAVLQNVMVDGFDSVFSRTLEKNKNLNFSKTFFVPSSKSLTQPYWLVNKMEEGYFNVTDQLKIGQPDVDPSYAATIRIKIFGEGFTFTRPVKYKFTDPVRGELYEPMVVLPPVTVSPAEDVQVTTPDKKNIEGSLTIRGMKKGFAGNIQVTSGPSGKVFKSVSLTNSNLSVGAKNQVSDIVYSGEVGKNNEELVFVISDGENTIVAEDKHEIKYDHIPYINYFHKADVSLKYVDLKTYNKKIGYIIGAGDKVPGALEQMGYEVTLLTDKELSRNNLQQFDAIITGVRAYNTNEWMNNHYDKLMKYVNDGGNLIVQYNTSNQIGPVRAKIGPYNFNISRNRITDENAPVTLLKPDHPVFNFPNKITPDDFKGWIQERSIYHAAAWDSTKYETVLTMNDPGEKPDEGSLVIAKHGKGVFVYTGIVFFRELPAGVPGAYRLLANIIALNRKKGF